MLLLKGFVKPGTQNSHCTDPAEKQDSPDQCWEDETEGAPPLQSWALLTADLPIYLANRFTPWWS